MKRKSNLDGIIVVNKPKGITSRDVVNKLTKILVTKKIGHTGTLDPLAKGVLICTVGHSTKLSEFLTSTYKLYHCKFKLGFETDTLDITGTILKSSDLIVSKEKIIEVINKFKGKYIQEVPKYSAVKIDGKKLYEYARNNEQIELPKREVEIKEISNISIENDIISFDCLVSKGTYIRSLIRDIGNSLGTYATMTELIRTKQGDFSIDEAYSLEMIENGNYEILSPEKILKNIYSIECDEILYKKISNGVVQELQLDEDYILYRYKKQIIALYIKKENKFRMYVKF